MLWESLPCDAAGNKGEVDTIPWSEAIFMLMLKRRHPTLRTLQGWAIHILEEAGAIRECEDHGWMKDRADPHARDRARNIARTDPPEGLSPDEAAAAVEDVLGSIGDACPECPPDCSLG
jgi:hypothetical protein